MLIDIGIFIVVIIIVSLFSFYLKRKNPSNNYYLFPGIMLTVLSYVVAAVSYFTADGWSILGYFFLFILISIASLIGTVVGQRFAN